MTSSWRNTAKVLYTAAFAIIFLRPKPNVPSKRIYRQWSQHRTTSSYSSIEINFIFWPWSPVKVSSWKKLLNSFKLNNFFVKVSPLFILEILHRIVDIFEDYFNECNESSLKENFVIVYEVILDQNLLFFLNKKLMVIIKSFWTKCLTMGFH